ncbi:MAG: hypothetical protein ACUVRX_07320 [Actinomycetota bacterium]
MRKTVIIVIIAVLASSTLVLAAWKVADLLGGKVSGEKTGASAASGEENVAEGEAAGPAGEEAEAAEVGEVEAAGFPSGESFSQDNPTQRYVTETQRHQNFFIALAEGLIKRLDAIATDYQPPGNPNSSYLYFTVTTNDGKKHSGTMVLKFEGGLWRIAAIRQLTGELGGGTSYVVPASFEDDLKRELVELQEFLTKVAQGRLDYMVVDSVSRPSDTETILTGRVVGIGGRIENARMTLRKDYNIWHLTNIEGIGG